MAWLIGHALLDQQGQLHPLGGRQLLPFLIKLELLRAGRGASHSWCTLRRPSQTHSSSPSWTLVHPFCQRGTLTLAGSRVLIGIVTPLNTSQTVAPKPHLSASKPSVRASWRHSGATQGILSVSTGGWGWRWHQGSLPCPTRLLLAPALCTYSPGLAQWD